MLGKAKEKMRELEASASSSWSHAEATVRHDLAEFEGSVVAGAKRAGGALKDEALDSSEFESTISRRNILLTVADGDVDRALDAVARQYLMTGRLSKLAASSLPVLGMAYSTIGPLWDKMRDCCVIAAIYGHDIEGDEEVQSRIIQCVAGDTLLSGVGGAKKMAISSVAKRLTARLSARGAGAGAISAVGLGGIVNLLVQKTISAELTVVQSTAREAFGTGGRTLSEAEYTVEDSHTLQAGKVRYISNKLNGLEVLAEETSGQASAALEVRFGLGTKAKAAKDKARAGFQSVNERFRVTEHVNAARERAVGGLDEAQMSARAKVAEKTTATVNEKLDTVAAIIVSKLDNSLDLPGFLAEPLNSMVLDTVEDIKHETRIGIESFIVKEDDDGPTIDISEIGCLGRIRGFLLYHWCPYDHAIGYSLTDPVYILMKICALVPYLGTQFLFYLIIFLMHDKRDDYQMVKFILEFKGFQALTLGIGGVLAGAAQYINCANRSPSTCELVGPGASRFFYTMLGGWLGCALLCWTAFLNLRCCRRNDRFTGGGRLAHWISYDVFCCAVCVSVITYAITHQDVAVDVDFSTVHQTALAVYTDHTTTTDGEDYHLRQTLYWCRVLYGLLSLPFIIFMIPAIDVMFTHASPTGYTRAGEVVPKRVHKTEREIHEQVASTIEDSALEKILDEMLELAIHGGKLPITEWAEQLRPTFVGIADSIQNTAQHVKTRAQERGGGTGGYLTGGLAGLEEEASDAALDQVKVMVASLTNLLARQTIYNLNAALELPTFLASAVESLLLSIVPDIQGELSDGIDEYFSKIKNEDGDPGEAQSEEEARQGCCAGIRAFMLYHYMPFDHGVGWSMTDPAWLICKILTMIPLAGTEFVVYFILFFLLDKSDEYQLIRFILDLKGLEVLSMGISHAAFGAGGYFWCINRDFDDSEYTFVYALDLRSNSTNTTELIDVIMPADGCDSSLAATYPLFYWVIATWLGTVFLVWTVFIALISAKKAALKEAREDTGLNRRATLRENHVERVAGHLSRVEGVFVYDILSMALCAAIVGVYATTQPLDGWEVRQLLYWTKCLYGLLALPYMFMTLPLMHLVFNKAPASGYDRAGRCRPMQKVDGRREGADRGETKNPMLSLQT